MFVVFFFQAEDGIRDLVRSRGLGDVYKRQCQAHDFCRPERWRSPVQGRVGAPASPRPNWAVARRARQWYATVGGPVRSGS